MSLRGLGEVLPTAHPLFAEMLCVSSLENPFRVANTQGRTERVFTRRSDETRGHQCPKSRLSLVRRQWADCEAKGGASARLIDGRLRLRKT